MYGRLQPEVGYAAFTPPTHSHPVGAGGGQDTPMATSGKEGPRHITEKANSQPGSCPCCAEKHKLLGYTTKYTGMAIYSQLSRARTLAHI